MTEEYLTYGHQLEPYIADTSRLVLDRLDADQLVVFEGAQGALLDIDHGTYPFVTSSNPVAGAACIGAGVGPKDIDEVWGVAKAYTTRVGAGPFPTELDGRARRRASASGDGEYGTTTGRARRVGWLDLVALRYAARINSLTALAVTKLDVLSGLPELHVCTSYRGERAPSSSTSPTTRPCCTTPSASTSSCRAGPRTSASAAARRSCRRRRATTCGSSSDSSACRSRSIGVGPGRDEIIWTQAGQAMAGAGDRTPAPAA